MAGMSPAEFLDATSQSSRHKLALGCLSYAQTVDLPGYGADPKYKYETTKNCSNHFIDCKDITLDPNLKFFRSAPRPLP